MDPRRRSRSGGDEGPRSAERAFPARRSPPRRRDGGGGFPGVEAVARPSAFVRAGHVPAGSPARGAIRTRRPTIVYSAACGRKAARGFLHEAGEHRVAPPGLPARARGLDIFLRRVGSAHRHERGGHPRARPAGGRGAARAARVGRGRRLVPRRIGPRRAEAWRRTGRGEVRVGVPNGTERSSKRACPSGKSACHPGGPGSRSAGG